MVQKLHGFDDVLVFRSVYVGDNFTASQVLLFN